MRTLRLWTSSKKAARIWRRLDKLSILLHRAMLSHSLGLHATKSTVQRSSALHLLSSVWLMRLPSRSTGCYQISSSGQEWLPKQCTVRCPQHQVFQNVFHLMDPINGLSKGGTLCSVISKPLQSSHYLNPQNWKEFIEDVRRHNIIAKVEKETEYSSHKGQALHYTRHGIFHTGNKLQ